MKGIVCRPIRLVIDFKCYLFFIMSLLHVFISLSSMFLLQSPVLQGQPAQGPRMQGLHRAADPRGEGVGEVLQVLVLRRCGYCAS